LIVVTAQMGCGTFYPGGQVNLGSAINYQMQFSAPLALLQPPVAAFCTPGSAIGVTGVVSGIRIQFGFEQGAVARQTANTTDFANYTAEYKLRRPFVGPKRESWPTLSSVRLVGTDGTVAEIAFHYDDMDRLVRDEWTYSGPRVPLPKHGLATSLHMVPGHEFVGMGTGFHEYSYNAPETPWLATADRSQFLGSEPTNRTFDWTLDSQQRVIRLVVNGREWGEYIYGEDAMESAILQGTRVRFAYDDRGAITELNEEGQQPVQFTYDSHGQLKHGLGWLWTDPNEHFVV